MSEANNTNANAKPKTYRRSSLKSRRINIKPNPVGELKKNGKRRSISWGETNTFEFNENKTTFKEDKEVHKVQTKEEEERHKKFLENRRRSISNEFITEKEMVRLCKNLVDEIFDEEKKITGNDDLGEISDAIESLSSQSDKKKKNNKKDIKEKKDKKEKKRESSSSSSSSSSPSSYYSSCSCSSCQRRKKSLQKEKEKKEKEKKSSKKNDKKKEKRDKSPKYEKKQEKSKSSKSKVKEKEKEKEKDDKKKNKNVEKEIDGKKVLKEKIIKKEEKSENKKEKEKEREKLKKEEAVKKEEKKEIVSSKIKTNNKVRLISYKDARELDLDTVAYIVLTDGSVLVVRKEYENENQDSNKIKVNKKTRNVPIRVLKSNYQSFNNNISQTNQMPQFQLPNFKKMIFQKEILNQPIPAPYPKQNYSFNTQLYPNNYMNFLSQSNKKTLKKSSGVSLKMNKPSVSPPWKVVKDAKPINFVTPINIAKEKYINRNYAISQENMTQPNNNDKYRRFIKISDQSQPTTNKYTIINAVPYYDNTHSEIIDNSQTSHELILISDLDSDRNIPQYNQYKNKRNPHYMYSPIKANFSENNFNSFEQDLNL